MSIIFNLLSIAIILFSFVFIVLRTLSNSGLSLKFMPSHDEIEEYIPNTKTCILIFFVAIIFRLFIFFASIIIYYIFTNSDAHFDFNNIFSIWDKWDSVWYLRIVDGYSSFEEDGAYKQLVFFPIYPWLIKALNVFINNPEISGLLVSTITYAIACVFIYKLVCLDYSRQVAKKAVILISIFPFAFFFGGIMTESTFLLFSVITLYYIRKHNWFLAGVFGCFAALSRSIGVFLVIPAIIEIIEEYKIFSNIKNIKYLFEVFVKKVLPILLIPVGTIIYLCINYFFTGDCFYFMKMEQKYWFQTFEPFFNIINNLLGTISSDSNSTSLNLICFIPELIIVIFMYIILGLGVLKNRTMYSSWLLIYIIINTSISWPLSLGRYFSCALPAFVFLASWCEKKQKLYLPLLVGFSVFFTIFLVAFIQNKQIM